MGIPRKNWIRAHTSLIPGNRRQIGNLARLPTGYRHALPPPPGGRGRSAQRGWGGGAGEGLMGTILPGRGRAPSPVPSPRGDIHYGPAYRDKPGKPGSGSPLPRKTAASTIPWHGFPLGITTHCPRPRGGGGGARSAGGVGVPERDFRVPTCGEGGGACREDLPGIILPGEGRTPSPGPSPPVAISPRSSVPGQAWKTGFWLSPLRETGVRDTPWYGFPPDIAMTAPAPGRGRGLPERDFWVSFCPGRGRPPSPMAISPRSSARGLPGGSRSTS